MKLLQEVLGTGTPAITKIVSPNASNQTIPEQQAVNLSDSKSTQDSISALRIIKKESPPRVNIHSKKMRGADVQSSQSSLAINLYQQFSAKVTQMVFFQIFKWQLPDEEQHGNAWKNLQALSYDTSRVKESITDKVLTLIMSFGNFDAGRNAAILSYLSACIFPTQLKNTNKWFNLITEDRMAFRKPIFDIIKQCEERQKTGNDPFAIGLYIFYKKKLIEQWNLEIDLRTFMSKSTEDPSFLPKAFKYLTLSTRSLYSFLISCLPRYRFVKKLNKNSEEYPFLCRISSRPNESHTCFDIQPTLHNLVHHPNFPFKLSARYAELEILDSIKMDFLPSPEIQAFMLPAFFERYFAIHAKLSNIKHQHPNHPPLIQTRNLSTPPPASNLKKMGASTPPPPISRKKTSMPSPLTAGRQLKNHQSHSRTSLDSLSSGSQTSLRSGSKPSSTVPSNPSSLLNIEEGNKATNEAISIQDFITLLNSTRQQLHDVKPRQIPLSETLSRLNEMKVPIITAVDQAQNHPKLKDTVNLSDDEAPSNNNHIVSSKPLNTNNAYKL